MDAAAPRAYRFEAFRVDLARRRVLDCDGEPVAVSSRAYDVLVYLIERRSEVVGKDQLLRAIWPHLVVEENNLSQAISSLRHALADPRKASRVIATVPGRGYRFVADLEIEVEPVPATTTPSGLPMTAPPSTESVGVNGETNALLGTSTRRQALAGVATAAAAALGWLIWNRTRTQQAHARRSIAVLPFRPVAANDRNEALELGMADTLITRLSAIPNVVIAPLSSVRAYRSGEQDPLAAGRALHVDAVLDGHIQLRSGRVRLTARLLDVASGAALWSDRFDEELGDILAVQDVLAQAVVAALEVELSADTRRRVGRRQTSNVEAWQLYLQGRLQWDTKSEAGLRRAIELYQAALALDPDFALAATGLADSWAVLGVFDIVVPDRAFPQARLHAERAAHIDAQLAEAQAALGHVMVQYDRDWHGGERQQRLALRLQPSYGQAAMWLANNLAFQGRLAEALENAELAQSLEPMSVTFAANVGVIQYNVRDYAAARARLVPIVDAVPQFPLARRFLARVTMAQGDAKAALALLQGHEHEHTPGGFADIGRALALDGQSAAARSEVARIEALGKQGFGVGYDLAIIHTALGDHDAALAALERGVEDHSQTIGFLNSEPALDPIRNEPRFRAVSQRIGLG